MGWPNIFETKEGVEILHFVQEKGKASQSEILDHFKIDLSNKRPFDRPNFAQRKLKVLEEYRILSTFKGPDDNRLLIYYSDYEGIFDYCSQKYFKKKLLDLFLSQPNKIEDAEDIDVVTYLNLRKRFESLLNQNYKNIQSLKELFEAFILDIGFDEVKHILLKQKYKGDNLPVMFMHAAFEYFSQSQKNYLFRKVLWDKHGL